MDPKLFASHLQHAQNMYGNDNHRMMDGPSLANHFVFRSLFEGTGGDKLKQQQQQQQQSYRHQQDDDEDLSIVSFDGGQDDGMQPQNLHKSIIIPPPHLEETVYTCPEAGCHAQYTNKRSFTMHFNSVHRHKGQNRSSNSTSLPTHCCNQCDKKYRSQGGLYWHLETVHKKRTFNCLQCSKQFKSYCGFYLHRKSHEGSSYECVHCFKTYSQKGTLKAHMKIHLGETSTGPMGSGGGGRGGN